MPKRIRNFRKHRSQRVFAAIDRQTNDERMAASINTSITIDAETAKQAVEDGRDPFEMARAASAALKGCQ